jgi:hypothetical protein
MLYEVANSGIDYKIAIKRETFATGLIPELASRLSITVYNC